jgi:hypothetical protein
MHLYHPPVLGFVFHRIITCTSYSKYPNQAATAFCCTSTSYSEREPQNRKSPHSLLRIELRFSFLSTPSVVAANLYRAVRTSPPSRRIGIDTIVMSSNHTCSLAARSLKKTITIICCTSTRVFRIWILSNWTILETVQVSLVKLLNSCWFRGSVLRPSWLGMYLTPEISSK